MKMELHIGILEKKEDGEERRKGGTFFCVPIVCSGVSLFSSAKKERNNEKFTLIQARTKTDVSKERQNSIEVYYGCSPLIERSLSFSCIFPPSPHLSGEEQNRSAQWLFLSWIIHFRSAIMTAMRMWRHSTSIKLNAKSFLPSHFFECLLLGDGKGKGIQHWPGKWAEERKE